MKMNKVREKRITMEIIVDAYDEAERAMGWFCYLEDKLQFPFKAQVIAKRLTSLLQKGETIQVENMAPEDECERRKLAVPLSQLRPLKADRDTQEAIEDWHYWVAQGYEF